MFRKDDSFKKKYYKRTHKKIFASNLVPCHHCTHREQFIVGGIFSKCVRLI